MIDHAALELINITKRFGSIVAVDSISLRVEQGEFFSLLGPSGCGKSTTLRMIAGFETPSSGQLYLDGQEGSELPPFRRSTNLVFQSYALFPHLSVRDNVAYGPKRARKSKRDIARLVEDALRTVKMMEYADRLPKALSGGQRQRVALARGIVNRPAVLLLDEPLGALDLKLRREMQIELKQIQREVGICFVYVTHDQEEALTLSDRIAVMNGGRIEQLGTPEEIYRHPRTRFCADFIGEANLIEVTVDQVDSGRPLQVVLPGGESMRVLSHSCDGFVEAGESATLVVRPQHLILQPDRSVHAEMAGLKVRMDNSIFQGSVVRSELSGVDGLRLSALSVDSAQVNPVGGHPQWATWSIHNCHLVANKERRTKP